MDERQGEGEAGDSPVEAGLRRAIRILVGVAFLLSLLQQGLLKSYRVAGGSMLPAFHDGDRVVVAATPGFFGAPRRGEAVIARIHGEVVIKRVAGVPGDTVEHRHLDGDEYFLLGDHRTISIDSREFGPVPRGAILGRVILRVPQLGATTLAGALSRTP